MKYYDDSNFLITLEDYLKASVHIGETTCTQSMKKFVFRRRRDGLNIFDVEKIDERIRIGGKFITQFDSNKIILISYRIFKNNTPKFFSQFLGSELISGRFIPGTFTNPDLSPKLTTDSPELILVFNPKDDSDAIREAQIKGIPVLSLVNTDDSISGIDFVIPGNNKDENSIYLIFWLLAVEYYQNFRI
jgi:small subunit ribosomal protein S2